MDVNVDTLKYGAIEITYLRHAGFMISTKGKNIYVDPFEIKSGERADVILITHDHFDHLDIPSIERIADENTIIVASFGCAKKLKGYNVKEVREGDKISINDIKIEVVAAYNVDKPFHKRGVGLGYIIEIEKTRIYHAGDTDRIPEMKEIEAHIALLPIGGTYTMDVDEASQAAVDINPDIIIPMHYNAIPNTSANPQALSPENIRVEILKPKFR